MQNVTVTIVATNVPAAYEDRFREIMDKHLYEQYESELDAGEASFCGEAQCSPQEISTALRELMNGDPVPAEFAYRVWTDPIDGWLGDIRVFVPGVGEFNGECDGGGNVVVTASRLAALIDSATDFDALKEQIVVLTGRRHTAAYAAYDALVGAS